MSNPMVQERLRQLDKALVNVFLAEVALGLELNPEARDSPELKQAVENYLFFQKQLERKVFNYEELKKIAEEFRNSLMLHWSVDQIP